MNPARDERGITLMEVVVVGVLAAMVVLALTGFYINSQGTWMEASSQALTQREGSLLLEAITDSVHGASSATVVSGVLALQDTLGVEKSRFWVAGDSLVHVGTPASPDQGPLIRSVATQFVCWADSYMVRIPTLELRSANRQLVRFSGGAAFYNKK